MSVRPELRRDPIAGRWVLFPNAGSFPDPAAKVILEEAPCVICSRRADFGAKRVTVLTPRDPVLDRRSTVDRERSGGDLYTKMSGAGEHEVIVEDMEHGTSLADFEVDHIREILSVYRERILFLRQDNRFRFLAVSKRHGIVGGAIANHAHAEAFALPLVPRWVKEKLQGIQGYHRKTGSCVYCDVVRHERAQKVRRVAETMRHIALAPYASRSPFEMLFLPKGHHADFADVEDEDLGDLAALLSEALRRLRSVLGDVAYGLSVESPPPEMGADLKSFHWHIEIHPKPAWPAALAAIVDCNPVTPEEAARALRGATI